MREDTTTIRVREQEKDRINEMQGRQWEVVRDLLDAYEEASSGVSEARVREIAREEIRENVLWEALE